MREKAGKSGLQPFETTRVYGVCRDDEHLGSGFCRRKRKRKAVYSGRLCRQYGRGVLERVWESGKDR